MYDKLAFLDVVRVHTVVKVTKEEIVRVMVECEEPEQQLFALTGMLAILQRLHHMLKPHNLNLCSLTNELQERTVVLLEMCRQNQEVKLADTNPRSAKDA